MVIGESDGFTGGLVSIASSSVEIAGGATENIAVITESEPRLLELDQQKSLLLHRVVTVVLNMMK